MSASITRQEQEVVDQILAWMREGARLRIFWQTPDGAEGSWDVSAVPAILPPGRGDILAGRKAGTTRSVEYSIGSDLRHYYVSADISVPD